LIQVKPAPTHKTTLCAMTQGDWTSALSIAATLALAAGDVYIMLFAMFAM